MIRIDQNVYLFAGARHFADHDDDDDEEEDESQGQPCEEVEVPTAEPCQENGKSGGDTLFGRRRK